MDIKTKAFAAFLVAGSSMMFVGALYTLLNLPTMPTLSFIN
jgi:hypothetical protein